MGDRNIELTRRKILGSVGAVGAAGAAAGLGTSALFSDEESIANNAIVAGTLDMSVTAEIVEASEYYTSSGGGIDIVGMSETADGAAAAGLRANDVKPGDWAIICFEVSIGDNPGYVQVSTENFAQYENGQTEPEGDVDSSAGGSLGSPLDGQGAGELQNELLAEVYGSYDSSVTSDNPRAYLNDLDPSLSGPAVSTFEQFASGVTLGGGLNPTAVGPNNSPVSQYLLLYLPESVGNEIQSDAITFDLVFRAEQVRNNTGFVPTQGLTGYWPLDSVGDGTAEDRSGNGNDGTVQGGVSSVSGINAAASFAGTSGFVEVPDDTILDIAGPYSEVAWVNPDSTAGRNDITLKDPGQWALGLQIRNGRLRAGFEDESDNNYIGESGSVPTDWTQLAVVYSGDRLRGFIDGTEVFNRTSASDGSGIAISDATPATNNDPLTIGKGEGFFDGIIDDVRIYSRALSDGELTTLYDETVGDIDIRTQTAGPSISQPGTIGRLELDRVRYLGDTDTLGSEPTPVQQAAGLVANLNGNVSAPASGEEYFLVGLHDPDVGSGQPDQRDSLIGIAPLPTGSYQGITAPIAPTPFTDTADSDFPPSGDTSVTATLWHGPGGPQTGPITDSDGSLYQATATVRDI